MSAQKQHVYKLVIRFIQQGILFMGLSFVLFAIVRWLPSDPAAAFARASHLRETPEFLTQLREMMQLEKPLLTQWILWWRGVLNQDLGVSWYTGRPIRDDLVSAMAHTLWIGGQAWVGAVMLAIPTAVYSVLRADHWQSKVAMLIWRMCSATPPVAISFAMVMVFSIGLNWLPVQGALTWHHSILPSVTIMVGLWAIFSLFLRETLSACMKHDAVMYAQMMGISRRVILVRFVLRRAAVPFMSCIALQASNVLCGVFVVEHWYAWPGFGRYFVDAVHHRDYPIIQAGMLMMAVIFFLCNGGAEWWRKTFANDPVYLRRDA